MTKAWYDRRKKRDPDFLPELAKRSREAYARNKQNPEWVAKEAEKRRKKRLDPEWAANRRETKRRYDEGIQKDEEKRKKRNKAMNEWRENNIERALDNERRGHKTKRLKKPIKYILKNIKTRATKNNIAFNLDEEDIIIPNICPVLGIPIAPFQNGIKDSSASIDRLDPKLGYTKGNIRVISLRANRLKSNCTDAEELRKVANYIENNIPQ